MFVVLLPFLILSFIVRPWAVMILVGIVHSFYPPLPAFGFFQTFVLCLLFSFLTYQHSNN